MATQRLLSFRITGLAAALLLAVSAVAAAQEHPTPPPPPPHPAPAPQAAPQATQHPTRPPSPNHPPSPNKGMPQSFTGVAKQLGTTPQALEDAYKTALATNPKLPRGQFIAANILAKNLGTRFPSVTTDAILSGLAGGKSIGQTLQGLGLTSSQARSAEVHAHREARRSARSSGH